MKTEDKHELDRRSVKKHDHYELIQQYRRAMHLHGDPSQSENESDLDMQESISRFQSALESSELH